MEIHGSLKILKIVHPILNTKISYIKMFLWSETDAILKNRFWSLFNFQMIIKNVIKVTIKRFSNSEKVRSEKDPFRTWKWFSDIGNYVLVISFYDDCLSKIMEFGWIDWIFAETLL